MLHSISWKQFLEFIAWAASVYYLFVGVRYYRRDIMALLTGKAARKDTGDQGNGDNTNKTKNI
jgi:hypothetical protein